MTLYSGVLRSAESLAATVDSLPKLAQVSGPAVTASWEASNLITVSLALTEAARMREETRGSHWREDFPERDDARFAGHVDVVMGDAGRPRLTFQPAPSTDPSTEALKEPR